MPERARGRRRADEALVAALSERDGRPFRDVVTDPPSQPLFADRLREAVNRGRATGQPVTVAFVDLDRFNRVNESAGHAAGNRILEEVAARLIAIAGEGGTVARNGGDEFAVVISGRAPGAGLGDAALAELRRPFDLNGTAIVVTASIGTAEAPGDATDAAVVEAAASAMRRAKQRGGDAHHAFASGMVTRRSTRLLLEAELRQAIADDQLRLLYQPQVDLASGALAGVEALVRWDHPTRGLLSPSAFIPLAEESGLIGAVDQWILDAACDQLHRWRVGGGAPPRVAVNVSARTLQEPGLADRVAGALARHDLPPASLELEVTETMAVRQPDDLLAVLMSLRSLGVSLAVDDFGSGYTVLGWLERWPLDRLKIDASFVATITAASRRAPVVGALITLSHDLGFQVVAEGIETAVQLETLRDLSCDEGQGFLFGEGQPGDVPPVR